MSDDFADEATDALEGRKSIAANSAWMVGGRLLVAAIQWATTLLIIRTLSVDEFGQFSLIFGILGMLSIVTDMGLGRIAVSLLQDETRDTPRITGAYIVLRTLLGILGYGLAVLVVALGGYGPVTLTAALVGSLTVIFGTASNAYSVIFQVQERMQLPAISTALGAATQMLAVLVLIRGDAPGLVWFMVPAVLTSVIELIVRAVGAHRLARIRYCIDLPLWWHLLKEAVPISIGNAMTTLYYRIDVIMLAQLSTLAAVATYSVAYKFVDIVNMIPWAASTAALPVLVRYWPDDRAAFERVALQICRVLAAVGALIAAGFIVLADDVVPLLYGSEYEDAAAAAKVVVGSQCIAFAAACALLILIAAGSHRRFPLIATAGLLINVGINLIVIPRYSYMGAAWATLVTDALMGVAMWWEVHRLGVFRLKSLWQLWRLGAIFLVTVATGMAAITVVWWPLVGVMMTALFVGLLIATKALGTRSLRDALRLA